MAFWGLHHPWVSSQPLSRPFEGNVFSLGQVRSHFRYNHDNVPFSNEDVGESGTSLGGRVRRLRKYEVKYAVSRWCFKMFQFAAPKIWCFSKRRDRTH